jgi:flavin-dependent dehydrogenase
MPDVVVVGASVAGSATAIHLASLGHSVQLIDQASFPRRKACGEGLLSPGVAELKTLGLLDNLLPDVTILNCLRYVGLQGETVEAPLGSADRPAIGVQRHLLDASLLHAAAERGVDVCLGIQARGVAETAGRFALLTEQRSVPARVIVAADGIHSRLRQAAGLVTRPGRRFGVSAHFLLPEQPEGRVAVHFRRGYQVYLTPVGGRLVNVALLLDRAQARMLAGGFLAGFRSLVAASGALPEGAELVDEPLTGGPFPIKPGRIWRSNLVLVGDAAGFYDGVAGDGMSIGLVSARRGAAAIHRFLSDGSERHLRSYERDRRTLARNSTLLARLTLTLASQPKLGAMAVRNLARRPETFARLAAIGQGERGLDTLRPRDLLALAFGI